MPDATCSSPTCNAPVRQPIRGGSRRAYCSPRCRPGTKIHYLKPGDCVPGFPPRRYRESSGYVSLRWRVAPNCLVSVREHRVVDGVVTDAEHVHHLNHDRSDNRPENLRPLTEAEHMALHGVERQASWTEIAELYVAGMSTRDIARATGRNMGNVSRILAAQQVPTRPVSHYYPLPSREEVAVAYRQSQSAPELAAHLGISTRTARRALKTYGLPSYKAGRPLSRDAGWHLPGGTWSGLTG